MLYLVSPNSSSNDGHVDARRAYLDAKDSALLHRIHRGVYCNQEDTEDLPGFLKKNALRIANYIFKGSALSHSSAYFKGPVNENLDKNSSSMKLFLAGSYRHSVSVMDTLHIIQGDDLKEGRIAQFCMPINDNQNKFYGPMALQCLSDEVVFLQQFGRRRYNIERFLPDVQERELVKVLEEKHGELLGARLTTVAREIGNMQKELGNALLYLGQKTGISLKPVSSPKHSESEILDTAKNAARLQREKVEANLPLSWSKPTTPPRPANLQKNTPAASPASVKDASFMHAENVIEYEMSWYGRHIAKIVNNGVTWNFSYNEGWLLPLSIGKSRPGVMPAFINNLFPEGYQFEAITGASSQGMDDSVMSKSERYLSNISIVKDKSRIDKLPIDILEGRLVNFVDDQKIFKGGMLGMPNTSPDFVHELNSMISKIEMPRFSGHQPKIPCYMDEDGNISPAMNRPFTHILKLPGLQRDPFNVKGVVEWASMTLAESSGLKVCDFTLMELESNTLGYLCERFDIPESQDDMRLIYSEDFCAVFSKSPIYKYGMNKAETFVDEYLKHSTGGKSDDEQLFLQFYINYVLENADFHLKNASFIRVASPMLDQFKSTKISPAYDIMNTRYFVDFPKKPDEYESMSMEIGGDDGEENPIPIENFVKLAERIGISSDRSMEIMKSAAEKIHAKAQDVVDNKPVIFEKYEREWDYVVDIAKRAVARCQQQFEHIPSIDTSVIDQCKIEKSKDIDVDAAGESDMMRGFKESLRRGV